MVKAIKEAMSNLEYRKALEIVSILDNHKFHNEADRLTSKLIKISQNQDANSYEEFDTILDSINKLIQKGVLNQEQLRSIQNILFNS